MSRTRPSWVNSWARCSPMGRGVSVMRGAGELPLEVTLLPNLHTMRDLGWFDSYQGLIGLHLREALLPVLAAFRRQHPRIGIVITAGNCEVDVGTQTGLGSVALTNNGNHIDAQADVTGITGNVTKDGFLCPLSGTGHKTGGTYVQDDPVTIAPTSGGTDEGATPCASPSPP